MSNHEIALPQYLGAQDVADLDPYLATAGFQVASMFEDQPEYPRPKKPRGLTEEKHINQVVQKMLASGCTPQQVGAFVAKRLEKHPSNS